MARYHHEALRHLLTMLSPFAPHLADELWQYIGGEGCLIRVPWPAYEEALVAEEQVTVVVQVNGKLRARLELPAGQDQESVLATALAEERVQAHLGGAEPRKVVYIPDKLINLVG